MNDAKLDDLYRGYFRHEMPRELPPLPLNETARRPCARTDHRSRYVLAAGIALTLGLGVWLSANQIPSMKNPPSKSSAGSLLKESEADGKKLLEGHDDMP